jgi:hypothetical protein
MTQYKRVAIDTSKAVFTLHGIRPVAKVSLGFKFVNQFNGPKSPKPTFATGLLIRQSGRSFAPISVAPR